MRAVSIFTSSRWSRCRRDRYASTRRSRASATAPTACWSPVDFIDEATRAQLMPAIDNLMLLRSIQVLRRLSSRNRKSGLFVNLSVQTLADERFFPGFLDFLRANESFSGMMTFEFSQADVAEMGALEHESLAALFELGYRFSIDRVDDLRMDFKALSERGFRFLKLRAARLLAASACTRAIFIRRILVTCCAATPWN